MSEAKENQSTEDVKTRFPELEEITNEYVNWRKRFFDLPVIVSILSRIEKVLQKLKPEDAKDWIRLKTRGHMLSNRRTLFVGAEAAAQITSEIISEENSAIHESLGFLIKEGNSLHKVRALRAMRFAINEQNIEQIELGLYDSSAWVRATASQILLRLNFIDKKSRIAIVRFIWNAFLNSTLRRLWFFKKKRPLSDIGIFQLLRTLAPVLWRERGGKSLTALIGILGVTSIMLRVPLAILSFFLTIFLLLFILLVLFYPAAGPFGISKWPSEAAIRIWHIHQVEALSNEVPQRINELALSIKTNAAGELKELFPQINNLDLTWLADFVQVFALIPTEFVITLCMFSKIALLIGRFVVPIVAFVILTKKRFAQYALEKKDNTVSVYFFFVSFLDGVLIGASYLSNSAARLLTVLIFAAYMYQLDITKVNVGFREFGRHTLRFLYLLVLTAILHIGQTATVFVFAVLGFTIVFTKYQYIDLKKLSKHILLFMKTVKELIKRVSLGGLLRTFVIILTVMTIMLVGYLLINTYQLEIKSYTDRIADQTKSTLNLTMRNIDFGLLGNLIVGSTILLALIIVLYYYLNFAHLF